jgi:hypothetical protein
MRISQWQRLAGYILPGALHPSPTSTYNTCTESVIAVETVLRNAWEVQHRVDLEGKHLYQQSEQIAERRCGSQTSYQAMDPIHSRLVQISFLFTHSIVYD